MFLFSKTEFMFNPEKDVEFINAIIDLKDDLLRLSKKEINYWDVKEKIELVKNLTKLTLKKEWERVKKGE